MTLLEVQDLAIGFDAPVVDGVSFEIAPGEIVALVGRSGSGKTTTALAIPRLLGSSARILRGNIRFEGRAILQLREAEMRALRGARIGMVFQDPLAALNPLLTIGRQLEEGLEAHLGFGRKEARVKAEEMLERVHLSPTRMSDHPHRLSGGMRQRVMLAMALLLQPALLIADEPTSALDPTVAAGVLDLVQELSRELGTSVLLVTHDLGVVARLADRVLVMDQGRIVEASGVRELFQAPRHAATRALIEACR
jgi:peptide/nickel transport system ATP-binding protein